MAGDWIKFDITTPDKPEVVKMASVLGIDQDAVVGKLLRVWVWADQNSITSDGGCNGVTVTSAFLDRLTFCPGFTEAMRAVGWLLGKDGDLSLPNFERHNGKTAKERGVTNRRVAKSRAGKSAGNGASDTDVTVTPLQKPLPEKRREERSFTPDRSQQAPEISEGASLAGEACLLMRRAGCHTTNPSHPDLLAAIAEGVTPQALANTVGEGMARAPPVSKPFAWAITTARARHAEGPKAVTSNHGTSHAPRRLAPSDAVEHFIQAREQAGGDADAARSVAALHGPAVAAYGADLRAQVDQRVHGESGGACGDNVVEGSFRVVR